METADGKYPPAKSCVMSLVKGLVEFITVCFSRPQRNEEPSLRAQKIPQAMVLTAPATSVWLSSPGPLEQLWVLSPVGHSGLKWKGNSLHPSQAAKGHHKNNLRALPGILIYKWILGTKQSASLKAVGGRYKNASLILYGLEDLASPGDVCPAAPI